MRARLLALTLLLLAPLTSIAAEPPITFQVQEPARILNDVRTIIKMVGGDKAVKEFNEAFKQKLGDKGLVGLDLQQPILGYVSLEGKAEEAVGVLLIPVTSEKDFLALLERLEVAKPESKGNGLYDFTGGNGDAKILMRFQAKYAYVAIGKNPGAALEKKNLVAPTKLYDPADKSLALARLHFDRLPKELRENLKDGLKQLKAQMAMVQLPPDASEAANKAMDELIKLGSRYATLLEDAQTATARIILDTESGEAGLELGLTGAPGSALAKAIESRGPSTNKFAGLIAPDTAIGLKLQLPLFAKEIENIVAIGLDAGKKQLDENAPPPFKKLSDELIQGLKRTVKTGEFDIAVALRGPDANGHYTVVGAVAFEDPSGLEKELRALLMSQLPPMYQAMVKLDVAKVGTTSIHQVKLGEFMKGLPEEAKKVFGEEPSVTLAFAPQGIFFAFGPDAISTMKQALMVKKEPSPAFEIVANPHRQRKLIEAFGMPIPEGLGDQDKLLSAFAISLEGGKELRLKIGTNLKVFEGAGTFGFMQSSAAKPAVFKK